MQFITTHAEEIAHFDPRVEDGHTLTYEWTVPEDGVYKIECAGAVGGSAYIECGMCNSPVPGGKGGYVSCEVYLTQGQKLTIYAGRRGDNQIELNAYSAYVRDHPDEEVPAIVSSTAVGEDGGSSYVRLNGDTNFLAMAFGGSGGSAYCENTGNDDYTKVGQGGDGYTGSGVENTSVIKGGGSNGDGWVKISRPQSSWIIKYDKNKPSSSSSEVQGIIDDEEVEDGSSFTVTSNTYSLYGYTFNGWNTEQNNSGLSYTAGNVITPTSDMILYAQWKLTEYTITYHLDGGSVSGTNPTKYTVETPTFSIINPTKTGYTFKGWSGTNITDKTTSLSISKGTTGNLEFTANWEPITYEVRVHPNNKPTDATHNIEKGSSSWSYNNTGKYYYKTFTYGSTTLDNPTTFYKLTGWQVDDSGLWTSSGTNGEASGTKYNTGSTNLRSTQGAVLDLYPYYIKNTYYIDYSGNNTDKNIYGDNTSETYTGSTASTTCKYDTNVTLATNGFSKVGYTFKGWNTKSDGSGISYSPGAALTKPNFTETNEGRINLYAIWEPITYTVNLHQNKPSDATHNIVNGADSTWTWNSSSKMYTKVFRYDHHALDAPNSIYTLVGWKHTNNKWWSAGGTNGSTSGTEYTVGNKNLTSTNGATLNLYPDWIKHKYTINYSGNNTTNNIYGDTCTSSFTGTTTSTNCEYDTDVTLRTNNFTKVGYLFKEWNTKSDGTGTGYNSGEILTKPNFTDVDSGTYTLYAIWEPITYTVNLHQNVPTDATHTINNVANSTWTWDTSSKIYTKVFRYDHHTLDASNNIFTLVGWKHTNNTWWSVGGTNGETSGKTYTAGNKNLTTTDKDVLNLYPDWIKHTYYIIYDGNDTNKNIYGDNVTTKFTDNTEKTTCSYDTDVTIAQNNFKKLGYEFIGWAWKSDATEADIKYLGGEKLTKPNFTEVDYGEVKLYAIWKPKYYDVVLEINDGNILNWDDTYEKYKFKIRFDSQTDIVLPDEEKLGYEFSGWGRKNQENSTIDSDGKLIFKDIAEFYPIGKHVLSVSENKSLKPKATIHFTLNELSGDKHLFAWFNWKPQFVDIYEGLFFEGQVVTYNDLLQLVKAWDYEDNYKDIQKEKVKEFFDKYISKIDNATALDESTLDFIIKERDILIYNEAPQEEIRKLDIQAENLREHLRKLFEEKEQAEQQRTLKLVEVEEGIKFLDTSIAEINYYGANTLLLKHYTNSYDEDTEVDWNTPFEAGDIVDHSLVSEKNHFNYRIYTEDNKSPNGIYKAPISDYNTKYLKTGTRYIGVVDITYQVSDKGLTYVDAGGIKHKIPNSEIIMEYTRRCQINFNYNPMIYLQGIVRYTSDNLAEGATFADEVIRQQAVLDSEDVMDNIPWWSKDKNSDSLLLHSDNNSNTLTKLQNTLIITGVSEYKFSSNFEYQYPEAVEKFINEFNSPESARQYVNSTDSGVKLKDEYYEVSSITYWIPYLQKVEPVLNKAKLLNEIYSFKDKFGAGNEYFVKTGESGYTVYKGDIWNALTSVKVTLDAVDQWGKWASNNVSEPKRVDSDEDDTPGKIDTDNKPDGDIPEFNGGYQGPDPNDPDYPKDPNQPPYTPGEKIPYDPTKYQPEPKRETEIILVNDDLNNEFIDIGLNTRTVRDDMRYINYEWFKKLSGLEFWGDYGSEILNKVFENSTSIDGDSHSGKFKTQNEDNIQVEVNDHGSNVEPERTK